jgi:lipoprotein-anchoring transpeptidase ErfK/SrfK
MNPARGGRRRRVGTSGKVMVVAGLAAALALAGCSSSNKTAGHDSNDTGQAAGSSSPTGSSGSGSNKPNSSPTGSAAQVSVSPNAAAHTNPTTPIVVKATNGTLQTVTMTNPKGVVVTGDFAAGKASWTTNEVLGYGKTYKIAVTARDSKGKVTQKDTTVTTINPPTAYPSVVPPPTANDIGVGMPLAVRFDKPIQNKAAVQKMLTVTSTPAQVGAWYWLSDTEVDYRPEVYWQAHTKIRLDIKDYGKDLGGGIYGESDRTIDYTVHDSWVAKADGRSETMSIYQNGHVVKTMPISMGKQATPTHLGVHVISAKNRQVTMDSCSYGVCKGQPGYYRSTEYYAERISDDGEFVHENPNSVGAQGSTNVSHGCINLNQANAAWFYSHLGVGDVVEVTNSGGPQLPLGDRIGVWAVQWPTWQAGNASS